MSKLPARLRVLTPAQLAPYEGTYWAEQIDFQGVKAVVHGANDLRADVLRDEDGRIVGFRLRGRLFRRDA